MIKIRGSVIVVCVLLKKKKQTRVTSLFIVTRSLSKAKTLRSNKIKLRVFEVRLEKKCDLLRMLKKKCIKPKVRYTKCTLN